MFRTISQILLLSLFTSIPIAAQEIDLANHPGKAIYQKKCVECHADNGEGALDVDVDPLTGNRSIDALAGRIERTMPEDNEDDCVGEEAKLAAEYIYHAFYSPRAQNRGKTIVPDVTHLTEAQILNSVTDLIGGFRKGNTSPEIERPGLKGHYTLDDRKKAGNNNFKREKFERTDSQLRFDYKEGLPNLPDGMQSQMTQFKIEWQGSIWAAETGEYEFTLRTRNGAKLFINEHDNNKQPTIDAWVAPDNEIREESEKVFLLGGRRYFVRLEYFKYQEKSASVELLWKTPHGRRETIPSNSLTPDYMPKAFVGTTVFPADDRSYGYERGSIVSRVWLDAVTSLASEAADHVVEYVDELAKTKADDEKRIEKLRQFAAEFSARAFRRPLQPGEKEKYVDSHFNKAPTPEDAIRRVVLYSLTSPGFLYPATAFDSPDSQWAKATDLALAIWDSVPDKNLRDAAAKRKLNSPEAIEKIAWNMQWDGRARHKVTGFFEHWLELSRTEEVAKDDELYPQFSDEMMADLRTSLEMFLDDIVWSEKSDYRQLLLSDQLFLNKRLGDIYGKPDLKSNFQKVSLPDKGRSGVITHPFLLTAFAYHDNTSPIHRGVFLTRNIVGMPLKPPPEALEFDDSHFPPNLTMREKVTEMTRAKACMSCHSMINPLGFSLEHYDAIGRWRAKERNKPIDDNGILETDSGDRITIEGPRDVAEYAAHSPAAHKTFVRQLFHHTVKQPLLAYGDNTADQLEEIFRQSGFNMKYLLVKMAITATQPNVPKS